MNIYICTYIHIYIHGIYCTCMGTCLLFWAFSVLSCVDVCVFVSDLFCVCLVFGVCWQHEVVSGAQFCAAGVCVLFQRFSILFFVDCVDSVLLSDLLCFVLMCKYHTSFVFTLHIADILRKIEALPPPPQCLLPPPPTNKSRKRKSRGGGGGGGIPRRAGDWDCPSCGIRVYI